MKNAILLLTVLFSSTITEAKFSTDPGTEVPAYEQNRNQCSNESMVASIDSRLVPGATAVLQVENTGLSVKPRMARWELSVNSRNDELFLATWRLAGQWGLELVPGEQTSFESRCDKEMCRTNLGRFDELASYSPCTLSQGVYTSGFETDGYFQMAENDKIVRAQQKTARFEGVLFCEGKPAQYGYRLDEIVYSPDVPNWWSLSSCTPTLIYRSYEFYDEQGALQHTIKSQLNSF